MNKTSKLLESTANYIDCRLVNSHLREAWKLQSR